MEAGCFRYKIKSFISDKYIFKQIILQTNKQNSAEGVRQPKLLYTPVAEAISFHQLRYYIISPQPSGVQQHSQPKTKTTAVEFCKSAFAMLGFFGTLCIRPAAKSKISARALKNPLHTPVHRGSITY